MTQTFPALVLSVGRNAAQIALAGEEQPRTAALKRSSGKRQMPVPGDRVSAQLFDDGTALIESIAPRRRILERRTPYGRAKILAANVDTLATVTSLAHPPPRLLILDQLLAYCELEELEALIVLTKPDLASAGANELTALYERLGYRTAVVDPKHGAGVPQLLGLLEDRFALLCGVSGVGKSTIFRALGGEAVVGEVSRHGLGRQTTSAARLVRFARGFLIDSPGVAEFGLGSIAAESLAPAFREFPEAAKRCRYRDCAHLREPQCGVQAAVKEGVIAASRYASYRRILQAA